MLLSSNVVNVIKIYHLITLPYLKICIIFICEKSSWSVGFFGKYLAMDICLLLPECHDSEVIFDWSRNF